MTSQPPLQLLHSTTRGRSLPRTVADARTASPTDDQVNASEDATPDQLVETCLFPSQLLTVEMLRRPLEFAQCLVIETAPRCPPDASGRTSDVQRPPTRRSGAPGLPLPLQGGHGAALRRISRARSRSWPCCRG